MSTPLEIVLAPRDGLFCKDGRGWHTSSSGRGHSLPWPWPSTILGALKTAWGRIEEAKLAEGPFDWLEMTKGVEIRRVMALRRVQAEAWCSTHRIWPAPKDALSLEGQAELYRLIPEPLPEVVGMLSRDDDGARDALWAPQVATKAKPQPAVQWWSDIDLVDWLCGKPVKKAKKPLTIGQRVQAHAGIKPDTLTADEGILYAHDVVEFLENETEWAIGLELHLPSGDIPMRAKIGSDGRLAFVEGVEGIFGMPERLLDAFTADVKGIRVILATPARFSEGWLPDGFVAEDKTYRGSLPGVDAELELRAAFLTRPVHISGWDMASNRPKQADRMVAAGSVYFFTRADNGCFTTQDAEKLWLACIGGRSHEGFGTIVPGVWHY